MSGTKWKFFKNIKLFSGKPFFSILQNIAGPSHPFIMWPLLNISKPRQRRFFQKQDSPPKLQYIALFFFPVFGDILTFQLISDRFYHCFGFEKYSMGEDLVLPKYINTPTDTLKSKHTVSRLELYKKWLPEGTPESWEFRKI